MPQHFDEWPLEDRITNAIDFIKSMSETTDKVKDAAIWLCKVKGLDPYYRYPIYGPIPHAIPGNVSMSETIAFKAEYEWERMIKKIRRND